MREREKEENISKLHIVNPKKKRNKKSSNSAKALKVCIE